MSGFPNKRTCERVDAHLMVYYRLSNTTIGYDLSQTANISQGGVLLTTAFEFKAGQKLELKLVSPLNKEGEIVTALVRGCDQVIPDIMYRTRVQFVETEPEQELLIKQLVDRFGTGA